MAATLPFKGDCEAWQARDASADARSRGIADTSHVTWRGVAKMSCIISKTGQQGQYPLRRPCCSCSGHGCGGGHRRSCHGSCHGLLPLLCTLFCPGPALVSTRPKGIHVEVAPLVLQEKLKSMEERDTITSHSFAMLCHHVNSSLCGAKRNPYSMMLSWGHDMRARICQPGSMTEALLMSSLCLP